MYILPGEQGDDDFDLQRLSHGERQRVVLHDIDRLGLALAQ